MDNLYYKYYIDNKQILHNYFNSIEKLIDGRICHSSIIILKIISDIYKIENYAEIGVHNGGSMAIMIGNKNSKKLFGIDLFEDIYNINKHYNKNKYDTYQYFRRDNLHINKTLKNLELVKNKFNISPELYLIQGNSYYDKTLEEFNKKCKVLLDLLFIDGDHTFDGIKNDFEKYSKYVKKNGYIIFDDYHLPDVKKYCDNLLNNNDDYQILVKFKSDNSKAIDLLIQKLI